MTKKLHVKFKRHNLNYNLNRPYRIDNKITQIKHKLE